MNQTQKNLACDKAVKALFREALQSAKRVYKNPIMQAVYMDGYLAAIAGEEILGIQEVAA